MSDTILVADDSQIVREMLQMNLQNLGYNVIVAEDGERALERIGSQHPDLLIVDVMMPKLNGFQICRRIKSDPATHETPVILLTARTQEGDIFWGKDCGADEYITKPFKTQELEAAVARLLKRRQGQRGGTGSNLERERQQRGRQGEECQVVSLPWEASAMDTFRKKYGEIRYSEALTAVRQEVEAHFEEHGERGLVNLQIPFGLSILASGSPERALQTARDLVERLNTLALSLYDTADRDRGHIAHRDPRTGKEDRHPLLSFSARLESEPVH
jgi:DNA-binding response OmpR family regulator